MRTTTLSNLFGAVQRLDHVITQAAGLEVMTEHDAQLLIAMITTCTAAANATIAARGGVVKVPAVDPTRAVVTHDQALDMDETAGIHHPAARSAQLGA